MAVKVPELKKLGVQILAMSTDSRFTHKIWQAEELSKMVVPPSQGRIPRGRQDR